MSDLDFQSDPFLVLLTDALRAGPGSPEWHSAVSALRERGDTGSSEQQMIVEARQTLESGRVYRSVRAGAGFTRKLMGAIEEENAETRCTVPTAGVVAVVSAAVVLLVVIVIAWMLFPTLGPEEGIDRLANRYFLNTVAQLDFDGAAPSDWKPIGSLLMDTSHGLMPRRAAENTGAGGGIVWGSALKPDQDFSIDTTLKVHRRSSEAVAQVFITDQSDFSDERGVTSHELAWIFQDGRSKLALPGGRVEKQSSHPVEFRGTVNIRIIVGPTVAIVEQNGKRLWAGLHGLEPGKARYVGLRFLRTVDQSSPETGELDSLSFTSVKVQRP